MIFLGGLLCIGLLSSCISAMELPIAQEAKRQKHQATQDREKKRAVPTLKSCALATIAEALNVALDAELATEPIERIEGKKLFAPIFTLPDELRTDLLQAILRRRDQKIYTKEISHAPLIAFSPTGGKGLFRCIEHKGLYVQDLFGRSSLRCPTAEKCCFASFSKRFAELSPEGTTIFAWRKNTVSKGATFPTRATLIDGGSGDMYSLDDSLKRYDAYAAFIARDILVIRDSRSFKKVLLRDGILSMQEIYRVSEESDSYPISQLKNCVAALSEKSIAVLGQDCGAAQILSVSDDKNWECAKVIALPNRFGSIQAIWGKQSILWEGHQKFELIHIDTPQSFQYLPQSDIPLACTAWSDAIGENASWLKKNTDGKLLAVEPTGYACTVMTKGEGSSSRLFIRYHSVLMYLFSHHCVSLQSCL